MTSLEKANNRGENKFPKEERLSSKKLIEELFNKGSSSYLHPFRLYYLGQLPPDQKYPQIMISVPKKIFKRAVDRNRIRRQIREAYRLNKKAVFESIGPEFVPSRMAVLYIAREKLAYKKIEEKLILILKRLKNI